MLPLRGSRQGGGDDPGVGEVFHALDSPTATNAASVDCSA